jgi:hypothetical protein
VEFQVVPILEELDQVPSLAAEECPLVQLEADHKHMADGVDTVGQEAYRVDWDSGAFDLEDIQERDTENSSWEEVH